MGELGKEVGFVSESEILNVVKCHISIEHNPNF